MKRILVLCLLFGGLYSLFPQGSPKFDIGIGPEFNMNSRKNFAAGGILTFDYNFGAAFALGFTATASYNFAGFTVIEPAAMFRWYFIGAGKGSFFVQADLGVSIILEDGDASAMFLGGLRAGFRLPLGSLFYMEPYGRFGYPFMFGIGVLAGVRF